MNFVVHGAGFAAEVQWSRSWFSGVWAYWLWHSVWLALRIWLWGAKSDGLARRVLISQVFSCSAKIRLSFPYNYPIPNRPCTTILSATSKLVSVSGFCLSMVRPPCLVITNFIVTTVSTSSSSSLHPVYFTSFKLQCLLASGLSRA